MICTYSWRLPYEEAVAALTLNTAKMLGIDEQTGSLELGKEATFFISKGDALDMRGNDVRHAFIQVVSNALNAILTIIKRI